MEKLIEQIQHNSSMDWIIWGEQTYTYQDLLHLIEESDAFLKNKNVNPGQIVALIGDFTPNTIVLLLSLIKNKNIVIPFAAPMKETDSLKLKIAEAEWKIEVDVERDTYELTPLPFIGKHDYYSELKAQNVPGLVLFTSGTSGFPKGAVHDFGKLLKKFERPRKSMRTVNFLLFDHWGGLNTLFHTLYNGGLVLALRNRKPEVICDYIQQHRIELLPVSPSFLNLLLLSQVYKNYDLSSLQLITYGTEPMPESTLKKAREIFNTVKFQQTYGLIELGVLSSKSREDGSLWVKLGGEGYKLRVVDNLLEIKAESAMLGYLNADSPFTEDGYFKTGDMVEQDGEYYKILGRKSELINVGGEKVYPQEVENVLLQFSGVLDATVYGEKHAMMGNIVCAKVFTEESITEKEFVQSLKKHCKTNLASFKVPVKIQVVLDPLVNSRFKKKRFN